jgi:pimeloyl-ACP methyl ester carboxylesterase
MKQLSTFALALCAALGAYQSPALAAENATPASGSVAAGGARQCEELKGQRFGGGTVEAAEWVKQGTPLLSFAQRMVFRVALMGKSPGIDAPRDFCRVTARLRPVPGSEIKVGVWLPQSWNGKMLGVGGGGFNGGLEVAAFMLKDPIGSGYAALATDAGHETVESAKFAYESAEQLKDYGYRANHLGAAFAKALIATYYSRPVQRAYFHGCSNGGRDALMLARRFPEDYDGVIAGAAAADFTGLMSRFIWNQQAIESAPKLGKKLELVGDAILAKCDALDGLNDGLLENPLNCPFDPVDLQCKNGDGRDCLNAAEVAALHKIYGGPRLPGGTQIYPGQPVGGENVEDNWDGLFDSSEETLGSEGMRWMVHRDPKWSVDRFDLARDSALAKERVGAIVDSNDPDLSAFTNRGGKLMLYHGWNDMAIPATATLDYYAALRKTLGPLADQQVRLFMVPGLMHCGGGPGATDFDALGELDRWVESGKAPEHIIATEYDPPSRILVLPGSKKVGTRPLCPWPKVAHYTGSGTTKDAANFSCK